jgi:hypothetical protein
MFTRFGQIFWGLLLVILDLNINRIDLLPDFIGYILIAIGCRGLAGASPHFSTASTMSWILVVLALIGYAVPRDAILLFGLVDLTADCAMMWFLLGGVMELATARQRPDLFERASKRRVAYVALICLATLTSFAVQGSRDAAIFMMIVWVACTLLLLFLILHLIHRAQHELTNDHAV